MHLRPFRRSAGRGGRHSGRRGGGEEDMKDAISSLFMLRDHAPQQRRYATRGSSLAAMRGQHQHEHPAGADEYGAATGEDFVVSQLAAVASLSPKLPPWPTLAFALPSWCSR